MLVHGIAGMVTISSSCVEELCTVAVVAIDRCVFIQRQCRNEVLVTVMDNRDGRTFDRGGTLSRIGRRRRCSFSI